MPKISQSTLRRVLAAGLKLEDPVFRLESDGDRIFGSIISPSFRGQRDHKRQDRIWDVLKETFGDEALKRIGMLLAFTPDEWDIDANSLPAPKRRKVG
jgi:acid stress-induced BolA-like protein IbaG/YrbA